MTVCGTTDTPDLDSEGYITPSHGGEIPFDSNRQSLGFRPPARLLRKFSGELHRRAARAIVGQCEVAGDVGAQQRPIRLTGAIDHPQRAAGVARRLGERARRGGTEGEAAKVDLVTATAPPVPTKFIVWPAAIDPKMFAVPPDSVSPAATMPSEETAMVAPLITVPALTVPADRMNCNPPLLMTEKRSDPPAEMISLPLDDTFSVAPGNKTGVPTVTPAE